MDTNRLSIDLRGCARCGEDHPGLRFARFDKAVVDNELPKAILFTHWASCPTSGQPVLLTQEPSGA